MNYVRNITGKTLVGVFVANISNLTERERTWFSFARMSLKHFLLKKL